MSNINKQELREVAQKATALNLDTAQVKRGNDGYLECPCCEGAGYVEEENDFCNIDGVALGVQFYGIGEHHGLAESYLRAANPATVLALLDELEAKDKSISFLKDQLAQLANFNPDWDKLEAATDSLREHMAELTAARARIAELEAREVKLPERYEVDMCPTPSPNGEWYSRDDVLSVLEDAGIITKVGG